MNSTGLSLASGSYNGTVATSTIAERGPHHKVVRSVIVQTNSSGQLSYQTTSHTELATGMQYLENGEWKETQELIEPFERGAFARFGPHKVIFAENLNSAGAIDLETSDAKRLQSHVLGLSYRDTATGKSVLIAELKDCRGEIVSSNQVIYADAFTGIKADVRYTYTRAGLEQDVILIERPPTPESYGLNSETTRLQVLTEFLSPPTPDEIVMSSEKEGEDEDHALDFGAMQMGAGRAFATGLDEVPTEKVPVVKKWTMIDGRTILFEEVMVPQIEKQLESLPARKRSALRWNGQRQSAQQTAALKLKLPARKAGNPVRRAMQMAKLDVPVSGVVLDWVLLSSAANFTLKGDTTYWVNGQVYLSGTPTVEGGAVIKYAVNATLIFTYGTSIKWKASAYRPVVFTAQDDDSVGEFIPISSGTPSGYYANPAMDIQSAYVPGTMQYVRFAHAQQALSLGSYASLNLSHAQFVDCQYGVGAGNYQTLTLNLKNALFSQVQTPFDLSTVYYYNASISAWHVTFDSCATLVNPGPSISYSLNFVNCILASVAATGWTGATSSHLSGNHNGFYGPLAPFGSSPVTDTQSPFAPTSPDGGLTFYIENGQGSYYLREGSPFVNAGNSSLDPSLKSDLARMTTVVPELFIADVNSSMTLGPKPIRDTDLPDLGYHYPAVDYVVTWSTVNNATLSIDQGTALAYTDPWGPIATYGLRLNPGGRLIVNGVPTNRVVFARLEAVQENTFGWSSVNPWITFKGVVTPGGTMVTPLAEASLRYADFPAIGFWNTHIGPISLWDWTYQLVSNLTLDGCCFQSGYVRYDSTGPVGRKLNFRNSVFERTVVDIEAAWPVPFEQEEELFEARNNLFYYGRINLVPSAGTNWTFTDNIFDHVTFEGEPPGSLYNGPVATNHHNAYVGMSNRLSPAAPTSTDPNLASLSYASGALGGFYLPPNAPLLVNKGSRLAADAGLYHFTSFLSNLKEGNETADPKTVNIGPHYLALVSNKPADSNNDGVADFLADQNGNGTENSDEIYWQSQNNGSLAILSPANNSTVSGIISLTVQLGANGSTIESIAPLVDGHMFAQCVPVKTPATSSARIEVDTRFLTDGPHTLSLQGFDPTLSADGITIESQQITLSTANDIRFPEWHDRTELAVSVNLQTTVAMQNYTIWFFDSSYPLVNNPTPVNSASGTTSGNLFYSESPANLGYADGSIDPVIYSISELTPDGPPVTTQAIINPDTVQDLPYPAVGLWVTAYADDPVDFYQHKYWPFADPIFATWYPLRWWHDIQFWLAWYACGDEATDGARQSLVAFPSADGTLPQTWPLRTQEAQKFRSYMDQNQLRAFLGGPLGSSPEERSLVRNFYGYGHGRGGLFLDMGASEYNDYIRNKRFRFVFFDGCQTAVSGGWLFTRGFNMATREVNTGKTHDELVAANPPAPGSPLTGPLQQDDYKAPDAQHPGRLGIRPGLFLGWRSTILAGHNFAPAQVQDYWTGEWCYYDKYAAYAHWEQQLMYWWRDLGRDFLTAYNNAIADAAIPNHSWPPWDIVEPVAHTADGSPVTFHPDWSLVIFGYGGMHFNEFNHAGDAW